MAVEKDPVIGRKPSPKPASGPLGTGTVLAPVKASSLPSGLGSAIDKGLGQVGVEPVVGAKVDTVNFVIDLTNTEMKKILPYLKKFGATKTDLSTYPNAKKYLQTNFDTLITNANGDLNKLISLFKSEATGYTTGTPKEPTLDQRTISKLDPVAISKFIDSVYLSTIGMAATPEQIKKHLAEFNKLNTGTVTSYDKVKNPLTGEMENVSTVTPGGFSQEAAELSIAERLKQENPDDYDRQKRIDFSSWLSQNVQGA